MSIKLTEEQYKTIRPALKWDYYGMALNYLIALNCREDVIRSLDIYLFKNDNKKIKEVRDFIANEYEKEKQNGFNHEQNFYPLEDWERKILFEMTGNKMYCDIDPEEDEKYARQLEIDRKLWNNLLSVKDQLDKTYFDIVKKYIDEYDPYGFLDEEDCPRDEYDTESTFIASQITNKSSIEDIAKIINEVMAMAFGRDEFTDYKEFIGTATKIYNEIHK